MSEVAAGKKGENGEELGHVKDDDAEKKDPPATDSELEQAESETADRDCVGALWSDLHEWSRDVCVRIRARGKLEAGGRRRKDLPASSRRCFRTFGTPTGRRRARRVSQTAVRFDVPNFVLCVDGEALGLD